MPRSFAQFQTAMWYPDSHFVELDGPAQHAYFKLTTQDNISAAGLLPLTMRRWARQTRGETPEDLAAAIKTLIAERYVFVDADTEELLVRTFIKADKGYGNAKRRPAIRDAAVAISSVRLKAVVAEELRKLGLSDMASQVLPDTPSDALSRPVGDSPSDGIPPSERVGVKQVELVEPPTPKKQQGGRPPAEAPSGNTNPRTDDTDTDYCRLHRPDGAHAPCGDCADQKRRHRARREHATALEAAEAAVRRALIDACPHCDRNGITTADPDHPTRCTHPATPEQATP